jgi:hypothetical protein
MSGGSGKPGPGFARNWNSSDSRKTYQWKSQKPKSRITATDNLTPCTTPTTLHLLLHAAKRTVKMADLGQRIANNIVRRPGLLNFIKPLASWYGNAAGWRKIGLR